MRAAQFTVNVDCSGHGTWDVGLPQTGGTVRCGTLEEAKRVARSSVGRGNRYELVIRDAYLRVVHRELIDASHEPPARPHATTQTAAARGHLAAHDAPTTTPA